MNVTLWCDDSSQNDEIIFKDKVGGIPFFDFQTCYARLENVRRYSVLVFQHAEQPCQEPRPQQRGALTEIPPLTGYEPNRIAEDWDYRHFTGDGQFTEHEDLRVKHLSFQQSIIASTCDSAESIATHPESGLDDEQLRALRASPLYLQEREASAERSQVYHSEREGLMSSSSQDPTSVGKLVAVFSSQNRLNQDTFSGRDDFPLDINRFLGVMNLSSDSPTRQMLRNLFLMETETICLLKRDLNSWSRNTKCNL